MFLQQRATAGDSSDGRWTAVPAGDGRPQRFAAICDNGGGGGRRRAAEGGGGSSVDVLDVQLMCGQRFPLASRTSPR